MKYLRLVWKKKQGISGCSSTNTKKPEGTFKVLSGADKANSELKLENRGEVFEIN